MALPKLTLITILTVVASITHLQPTAAQTRHIVGGNMGWTIPPPGNAYTTWASGQNFTVGDSLVFNFATGSHDVAEVREPAYGPCNITSPISNFTAGPATVNLTTAGPHYYICTFRTHCQIGQKLMINVSEATSSSPPSPPSSRTPSNGSPALTTVVPLTLLAGVLAALF